MWQWEEVQSRTRPANKTEQQQDSSFSSFLSVPAPFFEVLPHPTTTPLMSTRFLNLSGFPHHVHKHCKVKTKFQITPTAKKSRVAEEKFLSRVPGARNVCSKARRDALFSVCKQRSTSKISVQLFFWLEFQARVWKADCVCQPSRNPGFAI